MDEKKISEAAYGIVDLFYENKNPEQAPAMAAYMKNNFKFLGLKKPEREPRERVHQVCQKGQGFRLGLRFLLLEPAREGVSVHGIGLSDSLKKGT